jgi:CheY-like chemotaxis protein
VGETANMMVTVKKTILIVDDDESIVELLAELLVEEGYGVVTANNGETGLVQLRKHKPNLVLLDINMPIKDGWEFKREKDLDPELRKIPLFVITAQPDFQGSHLKDVQIIAKPINIEFLLNAIQNAAC